MIKLLQFTLLIFCFTSVNISGASFNPPQPPIDPSLPWHRQNSNTYLQAFNDHNDDFNYFAEEDKLYDEQIEQYQRDLETYHAQMHQYSMMIEHERIARAQITSKIALKRQRSSECLFPEQ